MKIAEIASAPQNGMFDFEPRDAAQPVASTMAVAAALPCRMRLTLPAFASWSWKNGLATVNHDGQNPAKTPDASPMSRIRMTICSWLSSPMSASLWPVGRAGDLVPWREGERVETEHLEPDHVARVVSRAERHRGPRRLCVGRRAVRHRKSTRLN